MTGQPIELQTMPLVLTLSETAKLLRVSKITIYRNPKKYGGKKTRGAHEWKFARDTVLKLAGYEYQTAGGSK